MNVGNSTINSGDANTSGTVINSVNTNVDGLGVATFNVADDHKGDIILDFSGGCLSNCANSTSGTGTPTNTTNIVGNGSNSQQASDVTAFTQTNTFQQNDANVNNNLTLAADSGNNTTSFNTGGNNTITTGNANVAANVATFANNNISGGRVLLGVVNIYGNLQGDIILPQEAYGLLNNNTSTGSGSPTTTIAANGSGSTNDASSSATQTASTNQTNSATIDNKLVLNATTGDNSTSGNTDGNNSVQTGSSNVSAKTVNVANSNISSGNVWLVIINQAGKWIGKILGLPTGQTIASSDQATVTSNSDGTYDVALNNNGAGSSNSANSSSTETNNTTQTNTTHVTNTLNLSANTGKNHANDNTGGNNNIKTGNTNIIANLVNFVNNNITGTGKLIVTLVNVFGKWTGNFVPPGMKDSSSPANATPAPTSEAVAMSVPSTPSPTPTPNVIFEAATDPVNSPTPVVYYRRRRLAAPTDNSSSWGDAIHNGQVKGAYIASAFSDSDFVKNVNAEAKTARQHLKINLAWLLLLLPVGAVIYLWRRHRVA